MSSEDRKLLEAVRNWRPPQELHPIAMVAFGLYDEAGNKLPPATIKELRRVLDGYGEDLESLAAAMEGMTRFMLYIGDNLKDQESSDKVGKLLREYAERFEPFWRRVAQALENEGENVQAAFSELVGETDDPAKKTAPKYGEKAPVGSVRLSDIAPPTRPPAFKPKKKS
ncbi:MAG: hypothetical protein AAFN74_01775 [Myxococcota bacterium]